ncbi:hypothetical protein BCR32DRAFT_274707 [Anaeromyces robustus]|uniref:Uncharacterized protein n=1 Tax=Anaeromyces robustus TaxID=1754192 RepID=A0A1Y1XND7_9FUNG|nr:hypothetical protein BCR32DRAFT_274707 [Anaeromyces robustus]|eukprot:ORX87243.1 hypothetical protein BCR32DRAFT_274707 [Anaeromyces robustus]
MKLNSFKKFPILRENYRPERQDWKLDLKCSEVEKLEIFGMKNPTFKINPS